MKMPPEEEIQNVMPQLKAAVEAMMNPTTPQTLRLEAYQACEDFKDNSPLCAPCGVLMSGKENDPFIRHFGLQLLENTVKFRWYNCSIEDKVFIKENVMKLMTEGTLDLTVEHAHIKDALSRVVVEMMKREWPQQWPSLMQELDQLCKRGPTQTELVLLVLLRLVEDVVAFQNVPAKRRRELLQALTTHLSDIFSFFVKTLKENFEKYQQLKGAVDENSKTACEYSCRLVRAVLQTLTGYLDWVSMSVIMDGNELLKVFCLMLSDEQLQLHAAECLLLVASRKGKVDDRKPLLILFSEDAMATILSAVVGTASAALGEYQYIYLKKLCQVLTSLGSQLCALWGATEGVGQPPSFTAYLRAIHAFTEHPSQILGSHTQTLWASMLRHEHMSHDPILLSFLPEVARAAKSAFLKVGFPSQSNSPSCGYARLDFDSDEDFNTFYSKYRAEVSETLRLMTLLAPTVTFSIMSSWLREQLQKPVASGEGLDRKLCNLSSPLYLEWDALTSYMECVMLRLNASTQPKPPIQEGIDLFRAVLEFDTQDPLILSCVLSCMSSLFPYITHVPDLLGMVLKKIFNAAVFSIHGQTKGTRSRAVKNVRRHACSVLVKICKQYPKLLMPAFEQLYSHVQQLSNDPEELSQMEKVTLMEALVLISNEFRQFDKQSSFIGEILKEVKDFWLSQEFKEALLSPEKFITYIGINQPPVEPSSADTCGINRSHMIYCINTIVAFMKRCKWPDDMEEASKGGFLTTTQTGKSVLRNPAFPHIGIMLECVLNLLRTLNMLWQPEHLARRHPDFGQAYELAETDKLATLGIQPPSNDNYNEPASKHPLARMQNFISTAHDNCYHILGNAGLCLGQEFYSLPNLAYFMVNTVFTYLDNVPNYRLRPILRIFLKPYIQACPKEFYSSAVLPLLAVACPFIHDRLEAKWAAIAQRDESRRARNEDDDPESQEVLEDQLVRLLTKEYIELLAAVCLNRRGSLTGSDETVLDDMDTVTSQPGHKDDTLSELGQLALLSDSICPVLVMSVFSGLGWGDGSTCIKCTSIAWPILKHLKQTNRLVAADAYHMFTAILFGLKVHGEHEGNLAALISLALQTYELLRSDFPDISDVLLRIPNINPNDVKNFDEKLMNTNPQKQMPEKKKRDAFRKMVEEIIGKSLGEKFKRDAMIKDLPPMYRRSKLKKPTLDDIEKTDLGLCALFLPEQSQNSNHL